MPPIKTIPTLSPSLLAKLNGTTPTTNTTAMWNSTYLQNSTNTTNPIHLINRGLFDDLTSPNSTKPLHLTAQGEKVAGGAAGIGAAFLSLVALLSFKKGRNCLGKTADLLCWFPGSPNRAYSCCVGCNCCC